MSSIISIREKWGSNKQEQIMHKKYHRVWRDIDSRAAEYVLFSLVSCPCVVAL